MEFRSIITDDDFLDLDSPSFGTKAINCLADRVEIVVNSKESAEKLGAAAPRRLLLSVEHGKTCQRAQGEGEGGEGSGHRRCLPKGAMCADRVTNVPPSHRAQQQRSSANPTTQRWQFQCDGLEQERIAVQVLRVGSARTRPRCRMCAVRD
eukprot:1465837-Rhodomonas_salina.1